jgi:chromosome segregation ATPase
VPGEEIIPGSDDMPYGSGTLIMVELSAAKQIQRHSEAGRQLVSILQNFSRLQEKAKTQEEEIEQWKQSLTYQSQELNRREMEIEAAQEQAQQLEADFERLEQQKQEIEATQAEVNRLREEFERRNQELEGAWAQLRGETNRLEERQAELHQMTVLDQAQADQFQVLLDQLSGSIGPIETIQTHLGATTEAIAQQQETLNQHWQHLEQQRASAQQMQTEVDQQSQTLQERWLSWQQAQVSLEQARAELEAQQSQLKSKQDCAQLLAAQIQAQMTLYQDVARLADGAAKVDFQALEWMPLEELQRTARDLESDLEKLSRFVSSQEEELVLQQQTIDEVRQQIQQASEYDRLRLETELADEQDRYQMLSQTLVGQRRNLQERQTTLKQHQIVLAKRQGFPLPEEQGRSVDIDPILSQIDQTKQRYTEQLQALEQEIQVLQAAIQPAQANVIQQATAQSSHWDELQQLNQHVRAQATGAAELWGRVNLYQEILQPVQDRLNVLKQQAEAAIATLNQLQSASAAQHQAIAELRETVQQLTGNSMVELAAS